MADEENEQLGEADTKKGRSWAKIILGVLLVLFLICTGICCGGPFAGGLLMNSGDVSVKEINKTWIVRGSESNDSVSALAFKKELETGCSPMKNGIRVLFNHLWYNAITDGYDERIWLEETEQYGSYALYVWGNNVFLRDQVSAGGYVNRVLVCDLDDSGWAKLAGR